MGFDIGQTFLALTTLYILVYALTIVGSMIGETWAYYLIGSG